MTRFLSIRHAFTGFYQERKVDPLTVTYGVIDTLIDTATANRDMTTVGRLREAKKTIGRAALAGGR